MQDRGFDSLTTATARFLIPQNPPSGSMPKPKNHRCNTRAVSPRPVCPTCDKVKLRWSKVTGRFASDFAQTGFTPSCICSMKSRRAAGNYSCPGFFDEEKGHFRKCKAGPQCASPRCCKHLKRRHRHGHTDTQTQHTHNTHTHTLMESSLCYPFLSSQVPGLDQVKPERIRPTWKLAKQICRYVSAGREPIAPSLT